MNISKFEQRTLHVLAKGGCIEFERANNGKIISVICKTREDYILADCNLSIFNMLLRKKLINSYNGKPYRINHLGLRTVKSQLDNQ